MVGQLFEVDLVFVLGLILVLDYLSSHSVPVFRQDSRLPEQIEVTFDFYVEGVHHSLILRCNFLLHL